MCPTGCSGGQGTVTGRLTATQDFKLNPRAVEFRTESSASEASSPGRAASPGGVRSPVGVVMADQQQFITKSRKPSQPSGDFIVSPEMVAAMPRTNSGQLRQEGRASQRRPVPWCGWESPPVRALVLK